MRVRFFAVVVAVVAVVSVSVSVFRGSHDNFQCHIRLNFIKENCWNEQKRYTHNAHVSNIFVGL